MSFAFFVLIALRSKGTVKDSVSVLHSSGHVPRMFSFKTKILCKYIQKFNSHLNYVH